MTGLRLADLDPSQGCALWSIGERGRDRPRSEVVCLR